MPSATPNPPPLPAYEAPVVDLKTGLMSPQWYKFFRFYDRVWRQMRLEIPLNLSELSDVDVTGLADTDVLVWDDANSTWKPGAN